MGDNNNMKKFPYIVLPDLSSEESQRTSAPNAKCSKPKSGPQKPGVPPNAPIRLPSITVKQPEPLSPRSITSSTALTRHIALSKQFAAAAHANSLKEVQAAQRRILLAHYEMQKSPRSLYPSETEVPGHVGVVGNQSNQTHLSQTSNKLSLEALAQLFPHKLQGVPSSTPKKESKSAIDNLEHRKLPEPVPEKLVPKESFKNLKTEEIVTTALEVVEDLVNIKSRLDGLIVHVSARDNEMSQLRQDLTDLQLLVLKEKKESEKARNLIEHLNKGIDSCENKIRSLEKTLSTQEKNILDKLLLLDGMNELNDSDSDSDFCKVDSKPSSWISSSNLGPSRSSSNTTNTTKNVQPLTQPNASQTEIGALKECINWVPVAPDFDKLLQIIALSNFRMDKNQSMKLKRTGNATSFKHADTINLTLFKNGLILGKSGFRSYATLSVIRLINEMFSGYFPTELHPQYPDGVLFVVTDKRSILHDLNPSFFGTGMKLSDSKSSPLLLPGLEKTGFVKIREIIKTAEPNPSCTSVCSKLSSTTSSTSFCNLSELPPLNDAPDSLGDEHKMIVLKLKNTLTGKGYRMRSSTSSTVIQVLEHVAKFAGDDIDGSKEKRASGQFDLVLPVPHGILTSGNSTLKEYGFSQNTLLYLKPCE